jgi:hypothetical protein
MQYVFGLDPASCGRCHDTLRNNGIAPTDFNTNPPSPVARP